MRGKNVSSQVGLSLLLTIHVWPNKGIKRRLIEINLTND